MGAAVATTIRNSGFEVMWASEGRSDHTRQRAEEARLTEVNDLHELCSRCTAIVSVCPPHAAEAVADEILSQSFQGLYVDANAISPGKAIRIGEKMEGAGIRLVDGGIVGGPPSKPNQTWLYLAGPDAGQIAAYFTAGPLETQVIGSEIGKASALKMCFAAYTKGTTALLSAILGAAESLEVRAELEAQWARYWPDFNAETHQRVQRTAHQKAWRFVGEMDEMVDTFEGIGLTAGFFQAAGDIYRALAHFREEPEPPDFEAILSALGESSRPD
jgi:3-hydroxyisobutyrate dehydrogenase-like beta-hydroxyacid dehydrogenase